MSGAEAILGVISGTAGLLSLSVQLAESARRLKGFYSSFQDAPKALERTVLDLETMSLMLQQIERARVTRSYDFQDESDELLIRCIRGCERSVADIEEATAKIGRYMARSGKRGKLYMVFKEPEVQKQVQDLEQAKSSLHLAFMMYNNERQHRQTEGLQQMIVMLGARLQETVRQENPLALRTNSEAYTESPANSRTLSSLRNQKAGSELRLTDQQTHVKRSQYDRKKARWRLQVQLPRWLYDGIWDIALATSKAGWELQLRMFQRRSSDAEIFRFCKYGDVTTVQRLIALDKASLLDTDQWGRTLLEYASFRSSNIELIRWLLEHASWLRDHHIMKRALLQSMHWGITRTMVQAEQIYVSFIEDYGLEVDLDFAPNEAPHWWTYCPSSTCLDVIKRHQTLPHESRSLVDRFEMALLTAYVQIGSLSMFLAKIGTTRDDPRLPDLKTHEGVTLLHVVVEQLRLFLSSSLERRENEVQEWISFAEDLVRNGVDPVSAGYIDFNHRHPPCLLTPLLAAVIKFVNYSGEAETLLQFLDIWTGILRAAHYDLDNYGDRESEVWATLHPDHPVRTIRFSEDSYLLGKLVYGSEPQDWNIQLQRTTTVNVFVRQRLPGTFHDSEAKHKSDVICWHPGDREEEDDSCWGLQRTFELHGERLDLRTISTQGHDITPIDFETTWRTQDDAQSLLLIERQLARQEVCKKRSCSQPPPLRRQRGGAWWTALMHLCPGDNKRRITHNSDDIRECLGGTAHPPGEIWASFYCYNSHFLGEIHGCQDSMPWPTSSVGPEAVEHTGRLDCPQGCANVRLDRLKVPEELRAYFPRDEHVPWNLREHDLE